MKKLVLALVLMSFAQISFASILIEPFFGTMMSGELKGDDDSNDYTGTSLGARVGWQNMGLQLGIDYRISTLDVEDADDEAKKTDISAFIGYQFPVMFRVYGAMQVAGSTESGDYIYTGGKQTIFGAGYTGLPFVAINFEMVSWTYDEYEYDDGSIKFDGDFDSDGTHYLLSLSVPFNL